jgi:hypothetical protein
MRLDLKEPQLDHLDSDHVHHHILSRSIFVSPVQFSYNQLNIRISFLM